MRGKKSPMSPSCISYVTGVIYSGAMRRYPQWMNPFIMAPRPLLEWISGTSVHEDLELGDGYRSLWSGPWRSLRTWRCLPASLLDQFLCRPCGICYGVLVGINQGLNMQV
jgi:hypothetical protein